MKQKHIAGLLAAAALLTACEKELDINYHSIEPLYVVEGILNEQGTSVVVTRTRDMEESGKPVPVDNLTVRLSDDKGNSEQLVYYNNGYYSSTRGTKGVPGATYTLSVSDGEEEFVSVSRMHTPGNLGTPTYVFRPELTERHMLCTVPVLDREAGDSYYQICIYKNGNKTLAQIFTDKGHDGGTISVLIPIRFSFDTLPEPEPGEEPREEDRVFRKGDLFEMELQTIDRPVYDYLYSLELSGNISFNPTDNFTGECLGYFTAYSADIYSIVFDPYELIPDFVP